MVAEFEQARTLEYRISSLAAVFDVAHVADVYIVGVVLALAYFHREYESSAYLTSLLPAQRRFGRRRRRFEVPGSSLH